MLTLVGNYLYKLSQIIVSFVSLLNQHLAQAIFQIIAFIICPTTFIYEPVFNWAIERMCFHNVIYFCQVKFLYVCICCFNH